MITHNLEIYCKNNNCIKTFNVTTLDIQYNNIGNTMQERAFRELGCIHGASRSAQVERRTKSAREFLA